MGDFPQTADGGRVFSAEFKRAQVQRLLTGEKPLAELSRELDVRPAILRSPKRHYEAGAATALRELLPLLLPAESARSGPEDE